MGYETYQLDVERAEKAPAARNDILAKRFGLPMEGYTYYFTYEETLPHRKRDFWQLPCSLGGDLSQGDDFCAFTFLFPLSNGAFGVKTRNYITQRTLMKLQPAMRLKYEEFIKEGSLIVMEGTVLDMITYSIELHDMLIDFMQHGFGVKSVDDYVRLRYAYGKDDRENFSKYRFMMQNFKNRVDQLAALITNNVRAANTIYPTNLHECEMRRDYQNTAIVNCEQLLKELQRIAEIFEVDLNLYSPYVKAIDREIGLIKKWRQRDKKMESYFRCKGDV